VLTDAIVRLLNVSDEEVEKAVNPRNNSRGMMREEVACQVIYR
jgi:hypothetical protein